MLHGKKALLPTWADGWSAAVSIDGRREGLGDDAVGLDPAHATLVNRSVDTARASPAAPLERDTPAAGGYDGVKE